MRIKRETAAGETVFWVINLNSLPVSGPYETAAEAIKALHQAVNARNESYRSPNNFIHRLR
jgi:hypothetical protein